MQDILKLKVRIYSALKDTHISDRSQSAAINTVSGVNMTTRRQLLKIKVYYAHTSTVRGINSTYNRECPKPKLKRSRWVSICPPCEYIADFSLGCCPQNSCPYPSPNSRLPFSYFQLGILLCYWHRSSGQAEARLDHWYR